MWVTTVTPIPLGYRHKTPLSAECLTLKPCSNTTMFDRGLLEPDGRSPIPVRTIESHPNPRVQNHAEHRKQKRQKCQRLTRQKGPWNSLTLSSPPTPISRQVHQPVIRTELTQEHYFLVTHRKRAISRRRSQ
ncbi:hypothetical protein ACJJTC_003186 [Scirpophaga incertulas]